MTLEFSFSGSIEIDQSMFHEMVDDGFNPNDADDVAAWVGGKEELRHLTDVFVVQLS